MSFGRSCVCKSSCIFKICNLGVVVFVFPKKMHKFKFKKCLNQLLVADTIIFFIEPPTSAQEVIVSNGTMDCVCVCKDTNQTVNEIMQQRKTELTVDTEALSSTLRKFYSVPDSRPTSTAIGALGAAMIGVLVAFIVLPDLFSALYSILTHFKNVKS